jgi:uncharacterized protein YigE (DUF2233 family)
MLKTRLHLYLLRPLPKPVSQTIRFISLVFALGGCVMSERGFPTSQPTIAPTATTIDGWEILAPGLERRVYYPDNTLSQIVILRIDPNLYTFRAHYQPGQPFNLNQWRDTLPGAVAFVNANFFDRSNQILGMLVADGVYYGSSYYDRGGMFQVENGQARVRSNLAEPYQGEPLEQAVQAFPMLVADGAQAYTNPNDVRISRRTAVGMDSSGRILLMATPLAGLSLVDFSAYLPQTDLGLVNAFNLDGGGSTMMHINPGALSYSIGSFDPVPAVLAVYPR